MIQPLCRIYDFYAEIFIYKSRKKQCKKKVVVCFKFQPSNSVWKQQQKQTKKHHFKMDWLGTVGFIYRPGSKLLWLTQFNTTLTWWP